MTQEIKSSALKLSRVVLYKHGIGYFERKGSITGPTKIELVCGPDEIDDMLKSLVALTTSGGTIDAITYDSSKTLESRLAEFGFDLTATEGLCGLLAQMKGIPVTVAVSGENVSGRVLGLDDSEQVLRDAIAREKLLTLYGADSTFRRIPLSSISSIKVDDENMATEMKQQLELLFQNAKKKDRKALSVTLSAEGEHDLFIAYSIPCPIWKTSYRLVMTNAGKTLLQGMAIVDNIQEEDWNEVQVVLVSASPISFIQPLYEPVQPERRVIAAQGITSAGPVVAERAKMETARRQRVLHAFGRNSAPEPAAPMAMATGGWDAGTVETWSAPGCGSDERADAYSVNDVIADNLAYQDISVQASESGEQFEYRINKPVTVPRNSSALLPIVQESVEAERISLYNETKNTKFPYAAVKFKNTTGLTLESGPVTVMESDAYAGEAMLDTIKPDDVRFLLYAVDQALPMVTRIEQLNKPIWRVRTAGGALYLDYKATTTKNYQVDNLSDRKKTLYVEHPITQGSTLTSEVKPSETTDSYYRFAFELEPGTPYELSVSEETETFQYVWLTDANSLEVSTINWLCAQNFADKKFIAFLTRILEMRAQIIQLRTDLNHKKMMMEEHAKDQKRARENLQSLGTNNERYRKLIDTAEDRIQEDRKEMAELNHQLTQREREYANHVNASFTAELIDTVK